MALTSKSIKYVHTYVCNKFMQSQKVNKRMRLSVQVLLYMHACLDQLSTLFPNPSPSPCYTCKDFGSIFSTLLPGASAKLAPQEGHSVLDGLEVRVAFGNVWKESLSELSGGQRYHISEKRPYLYEFD